MVMPGEPRRVLTPDVFAALVELPRLRRLDLAGSVVGDEVLAALPRQLISLGLRGCIGLTATGLLPVSRLPAQVEHEFSNIPVDALDAVGGGARDGVDPRTRQRVVEHSQQEDELKRDLDRWLGLMMVLKARDLLCLSFHGSATPQLLQLLAEQSALRELEISFVGKKARFDLDFTAGTPQLERLVLRRPPPFNAAPLGRLVSLRCVELYDVDVNTLANVHATVSDRVRVVGQEVLRVSIRSNRPEGRFVLGGEFKAWWQLGDERFDDIDGLRRALQDIMARPESWRVDDDGRRAPPVLLVSASPGTTWNDMKDTIAAARALGVTAVDVQRALEIR
jgi:hypothetical protein